MRTKVFPYHKDQDNKSSKKALLIKVDNNGKRNKETKHEVENHEKMLTTTIRLWH